MDRTIPSIERSSTTALPTNGNHFLSIPNHPAGTPPCNLLKSFRFDELGGLISHGYETCMLVQSELTGERHDSPRDQCLQRFRPWR
jgi:hypothetical protein